MKKEEKEEEGKVQKNEMLEKCKELIRSLSLMEMKKDQKVRREYRKQFTMRRKGDDNEKEKEKEKESRKGARRPKARQALVKFGKWLFLFLIVGQNC